jgi:ABC-type nitrate/sulfonate/bicarbonate transport system substrate-binding protein
MIVLVILASLLLGATAWAAPAKPLRIGTMPSTIGVPVQFAYENGYYKDEGLDVEIVMFVNGAPINEALGAKQVDVAASGGASVFSLAIGSCNWVGEINTTGGQGLYVRPDSKVLSAKGKLPAFPKMYGSVETIKGANFIAALGTTAQFMVVRYVQRFGLKDNDVKTISMDFGPGLQAFKANQGDILSSVPPFSFDAEAAGYVLAASFEDATGVTLYDGLLARKDIVASRRADVVKFVKATYRACQALQDKELRAKFSIKWFGENGRVYDAKTMANEIAARDYITKDFLKKPGFVFGQGMVDMSVFYAAGGKIEKENVPNVQKSFDTSVLKDAIGVDVKVAK